MTPAHSRYEPDRPISLYINSPGGSLTATTAIYDTMRYIRPEVHTYGLGQAASAAAMLFAGGAAGHRAVVPSARVLIHQPSADGLHGPVSDLEIQAAEVSRMRRVMEETLDIVIRARMLGRLKHRIAEITAERSGQSVEQVVADADRDRWFSPAASESLCCGACGPPRMPPYRRTARGPRPPATAGS